MRSSMKGSSQKCIFTVGESGRSTFDCGIRIQSQTRSRQMHLQALCSKIFHVDLKQTSDHSPARYLDLEKSREILL